MVALVASQVPAQPSVPEVKPYVVDDQLCDECQGVHSSRKFAPYFCANVVCLKVGASPFAYNCGMCWGSLFKCAC